jgi:3-oxoacyl-[acyl-carrier protein] reductase
MAKGDPHVALVTGAAIGIGRSFAVALAGKGISVIGVDLTDDSETAKLVEAKGAKYASVTADVADLDAMRAGVDQAAASLGGLDIVVANAGIYPSGPFEEMPLEEWQNLMRVNLDGVYCTAQVGLPHLRKAGWGRIVVVSSATVWYGMPNQTAYVTSKAGILGFVRSLAGEVGEAGITVNAITPGLISTAHALNDLPADLFEMVADMQAVKRRMQPEDLNSTLLYLVDEASDLVTAQAINCDGGLAKH